MSGYVAVLAPPGAPPGWQARLIAEPPPGWSVRVAGAAHIFQRKGREDDLRIVFGGVVLGDVFARLGTPAPDRGLALLRPQIAARRLTDQAFGAYVVIGRDPETGEAVVYRDPSGDMDAVVWRRDGAVLVASAAPTWLDPLLPPELAVDWDKLAAFAGRPVLQSADVALVGLQGLAPGELWSDDRCSQLWRPANFAAPGRRLERADPEALVAVIDHAVAAEAEGLCLLELSGGLDSAIVGSALATAGLPVQAVNYASSDAEGDERVFAKAAAERFGFDLTVVEKPSAPFELAALSRVSAGFRPGRNGFDHHHDADVAARAARLGAGALMTGQGGDHVFFQTPSSLIAADGLGHGMSLDIAAALARWQGVSVYRLLREGLMSRWRRVRPDGAVGPHLTAPANDQARAAREHPWLTGLEGAPPAKRLQAESLAFALSVRSASLRRDVLPVRHPLLNQSVVEHTLAISVLDLVRGGTDRGLARFAFADRLPAVIAKRHGKGRLTSHYGRSFAQSLGELRPLLLDGELAREGVIDRSALDPALTVEAFLWRGGFAQIINLMMLELWARNWVNRRAAPEA